MTPFLFPSRCYSYPQSRITDPIAHTSNACHELPNLPASWLCLKQSLRKILERTQIAATGCVSKLTPNYVEVDRKVGGWKLRHGERRVSKGEISACSLGDRLSLAPVCLLHVCGTLIRLSVEPHHQIPSMPPDY
jgi:hypothetical protein